MAKMGRPTKYYPALCQDIYDYFSIEHTRFEKTTYTDKKGNVKEISKEVANSLPQIVGWCASKFIATQTLHQWRKKYPDFNDAYISSKQLQRDMLIDLSLRGFYSGRFAQFTAKNITDMRDVREIEHTDKTQEKWLQIMANAGKSNIMKVVSKKREGIE